MTLQPPARPAATPRSHPMPGGVRWGAVILVWLAAAGSGLEGQRSGLDLRVPPIPIDTFSLANGLRVIVSEDHSTPIVAVEMWYDVGSALEPVGRTGFAHLFEHLAFEDTENMADGEFGRLVARAGGRYNGATDADRTAFNELLPSNRVNLALWSHAERMARLRLGDDDFETQRNVVAEERRLRIENQPYASSRVSVDSVAWRDYPPYRHPVAGAMADLDEASVDDARDFYRRFYAPNHAVLAVVGDVSSAQVREMVERWFGDLAPGATGPTPPAAPPYPRRDGERRHTETDPLAQLPLVWMAYNLPPAAHPDHPALALLAQVLATGESSRLRRRLVNEEGAALDVVAQIDRRKQAGLLLMGAAPNQGVDAPTVERLMDDEIDRVVREGVEPDELEAARNQVLTGAVTQRMTVESKAALLQSYALYYGSPYRVNTDLDRLRAVTVADVQRVAATYLVASNRTVVTAQPRRAAGDQW